MAIFFGLVLNVASEINGGLEHCPRRDGEARSRGT